MRDFRIRKNTCLEKNQPEIGLFERLICSHLVGFDARSCKNEAVFGWLRRYEAEADEKGKEVRRFKSNNVQEDNP